MTKQTFAHLDPNRVVAREVDGAWLVGFAFTTKEDGERAMRAMADLYNNISRLCEALDAP